MRIGYNYRTGIHIQLADEVVVGSGVNQYDCFLVPQQTLIEFFHNRRNVFIVAFIAPVESEFNKRSVVFVDENQSFNQIEQFETVGQYNAGLG